MSLDSVFSPACRTGRAKAEAYSPTGHQLRTSYIGLITTIQLGDLQRAGAGRVEGEWPLGKSPCNAGEETLKVEDLHRYHNVLSYYTNEEISTSSHKTGCYPWR